MCSAASRPRAGRTREWAALEEDARLVAEAGAFAVVLEAIAEPLAAKITSAISIPTIGIGASAACDGQILVMEDMLGLSPRCRNSSSSSGRSARRSRTPSASYAEAGAERSRFPAEEHTYAMKAEDAEPAREAASPWPGHEKAENNQHLGPSWGTPAYTYIYDRQLSRFARDAVRSAINCAPGGAPPA